MTQQTMDCSEARISLGVYVLGAIDPAERAQVDAHLTTCRDCRDELAGLAGLPALLARVSKEEAIALADTGDSPLPLAEVDSPEPPRELLATVLDLTAARRRRRWRDATLAVAAAAIVAVGVFGGLQLGSHSAQPGTTASGQLYLGPPNGPMQTATGNSGDMTATVGYTAMGWGTQLDAKVTGIAPGTNCQLWVVSSSGDRYLAGNWVTDNDEGKVWYPGSVGLSSKDIASFEITVGHGQEIHITALSLAVVPGPGIRARVTGAGGVVVGGFITLVVVLAVASAAGFAMRHRQGRFRPATEAPEAAVPSGGALSAADLGAPLGTRATLVQFSTEVCAYCGPTRKLLTEVAGARDGVAFVEIDAAQRMDLTRRLHVLATPTVLVLDALGGIASRASGPLRRADLLTAVGAVLDVGGGS